jgi:NAD(P)-dependent dehydrogenase (short-subunit alcohol dehydrogenase family)
VRTAVADIADRKSVEAVFTGMASVDHLVITAGGLAGGRLAETDPDELLTAVRERIAGPLYAIKAALALMPPTASIVLTGGQFSDRPSGNGVSVISAAVRGIEALARSLALELKPIRVNVISPGFVDRRCSTRSVRRLEPPSWQKRPKRFPAAASADRSRLLRRSSSC